jgi:hypothetical protein
VTKTVFGFTKTRKQGSSQGKGCVGKLCFSLIQVETASEKEKNCSPPCSYTLLDHQILDLVCWGIAESSSPIILAHSRPVRRNSDQVSAACLAVRQDINTKTHGKQLLLKTAELLFCYQYGCNIVVVSL